MAEAKFHMSVTLLFHGSFKLSSPELDWSSLKIGGTTNSRGDVEETIVLLAAMITHTAAVKLWIRNK